MKFPAGTDGGTISTPRDEDAARELRSFTGAIEVESGSGKGFVLADKGTLFAAYFRSDQGSFKGNAALSHISFDTDSGDDEIFSLRSYNPSEFSRAISISREEGLILPSVVRILPSEEETAVSSLPPSPSVNKIVSPVPVTPRLPDEARFRKIMSLPGVLAVSAFFEGFPVQSYGDKDFEHVAAFAEDFVRAGTKVAQEMGIGDLDQLILETGSNKLIIAPCGDLYLCLFTSSDAQLGLIRVLLRSIQKESAG
ncbi:roadblock/LC7 domain-containing protein [Methanoregula sp.]|uniref:roadblock/LC7 domain-containing protein n=1 Tax=Methanoregula sp. TaxID=2052170 RepID=UPI00236EAD15|nr:roadblock/LC7 domain-containing protein [Methanoregula sp.]MDD1685507.1 roadblock/LC7 domain-containing protein [Methanoregula sp.]